MGSIIYFLSTRLFSSQHHSALRRSGYGVVFLLLGSLISACAAGGRLREDAKLIREKITTARDRGSYRCTPGELALAESNLEFLEYELSEGSYRRAAFHHRAALANINKALKNTDPDECAEKHVIILGNPDRDADGIKNEEDQCPDEPEDLDGFEDTNGCPDPDNDGDTVLDLEDQCPMEAGDPNNGGCPVLDRDADGIPDNTDQCPDIPEDLDGNQDEDGCPEEENLDADNDTILDAVDQCPQDPEDFDNYQDGDGCPEPDNDMDGVLDAVDACPLQAGKPENSGCPVSDRDGDTINDDIDSCPDIPGSPPDGCPKRVLVVKTNNKIEIKKQIRFATSRARIKGALSFVILDQVAAVMKSNPNIKVVIEGHTDSIGSAAKNLKLSDGRANAVRDALMERGVTSDRVSAIGYGESKPIASNKTRKGRATNRRVEFNIVMKAADSATPAVDANGMMPL